MTQENFPDICARFALVHFNLEYPGNQQDSAVKETAATFAKNWLADNQKLIKL